MRNVTQLYLNFFIFAYFKSPEVNSQSEPKS